MYVITYYVARNCVRHIILYHGEDVGDVWQLRLHDETKSSTKSANKSWEVCEIN